MKKLGLICVLVMMVASWGVRPAEAKVDRQPGGIPAFFVGCCWGIREGSMWNEGSDLHWREWMRVVPFVGIVMAVWDGIDSANGMTSQEWAKQNAANWY